MSHVNPADDDFGACDVTLADLIDLQQDAERRGFSSRWTSVSALRAHVHDGPMILMPLMREERDGALRAYRCLVRFQPSNASEGEVVVVTIDVAPDRLRALGRADGDRDDLRVDLAHLPVVFKP